MKRCSSISVMRCSAIAKWMSVHNLLTLCARAVLGVSFALVRASLSSLLFVSLLYSNSWRCQTTSRVEKKSILRFGMRGIDCSLWPK